MLFSTSRPAAELVPMDRLLALADGKNVQEP
jgi:hypothetical protein